jgi:hypothetical protein
MFSNLLSKPSNTTTNLASVTSYPVYEMTYNENGTESDKSCLRDGVGSAPQGEKKIAKIKNYLETEQSLKTRRFPTNAEESSQSFRGCGDSERFLDSMTELFPAAKLSLACER